MREDGGFRGKREGGFGRRREGGFGGGRGGGFNSGPREEHDAVCAECGKQCKVPFKPSGDRPVYCQDCFKAKRSRSSDRY